MEVNSVSKVLNNTQNYSNSSYNTNAERFDSAQTDSQPTDNEEVKPVSNGADRQERIEKAVANLNKAAQQSNVSVELEYDKNADRVVMKFIDKNHNELVKQIPSDSVLEMDVQIRKFVGVLFDKFI